MTSSFLQKHEITRLPKIPTANYDDQPETVEISSDEEEEEEDQDDDLSPRTVRGSPKDQASGETEAGEGDVDMDDDEGEDEGHPMKKRRTGVRNMTVRQTDRRSHSGPLLLSMRSRA